MQSAKNNLQGLTLMETVIALGILVVGIISVISLSTASISLSKTSEQQIVVANLAREGLEVVREVRDFSKSGNVSSVFSDSDTRFFNTDDDPLTTEIDAGCYIVDASANFGLKTLATDVLCTGDNFTVTSCSNCRIYYNELTNLYSHTATGLQTSFYRVVKIVNTSATEKKILSKVFWTERNRTHEILLETHLTDW
ncbi:MAG: hypothetical protein ABIA91_02465 [Patescibacteria group bacterium]